MKVELRDDQKLADIFLWFTFFFFSLSFLIRRTDCCRDGVLPKIFMSGYKISSGEARACYISIFQEYVCVIDV